MGKEDPVTVRHASEADKAFWLSLDRHLPEGAFERKLASRHAFVLEVAGEGLAILRCSLFWESIPFCDLLYVAEGERRRGRGRALTEHWEREMKRLGFRLVMTSTQADEEGQHFWRRLGYRDCGSFILPFPGYEQPPELILAKPL
jgi:GNAT superfamily N-acetyltransferase